MSISNTYNIFFNEYITDDISRIFQLYMELLGKLVNRWVPIQQIHQEISSHGSYIQKWTDQD